MSRHHIQAPIIYTPPPAPKKIEKKRRIGVSALSEFDEAADAGQAMPVRLLAGNFPEIEGADRKPRNQGRLSQSTLTVLLRAQELD